MTEELCFSHFFENELLGALRRVLNLEHQPRVPDRRLDQVHEFVLDGRFALAEDQGAVGDEDGHERLEGPRAFGTVAQGSGRR